MDQGGKQPCRDKAESGSITYTGLLGLPKITVNEMRWIVWASSTAPQKELEKGQKFYFLSHLYNFEGKLLTLIQTSIN